MEEALRKVFLRVWTLKKRFVVALPDDAPPVPEDAQKIQRERHDHLVQEVKRTLKRNCIFLEERLLKREWEELHTDLGSDMFYFLLKYALIFESDSKTQICGPSLESCYFAQKMKKASGTAAREEKIWRSGMFYNETFTKKPGIRLAADGRPSRNQAKKLCATIFGSSSGKLHKRLNDTVTMMHKLLKNHAKTRYGFFLRIHCPLPNGLVFRDRDKNKCRKDGDCNDDEDLTLLEDILGGKEFSYEELLASRSTHHQVTTFVWACVLRLVPKTAWGCEDNKRLTRKLISEQIVKLVGRHQQHVDLSDIQRWKMKCCWWIPKTKTRLQYEVHKQMVQRWLQWLLNDVVIPLIRNHFYVTEMGKQGSRRNEVAYFRKPLWRAMVQMQTQKLKQMFQPLMDKDDLANAFNNSLLPIVNVRFVPKASDMRVIENFRVANKMRLMQQTLAVLQWELMKRRPHLLGASMFSRKEAQRRIASCPLLKASSSITSPPAIVTLDIKGAFDVIHMGLLLKMLEEDGVLSRDCYVLRKTSALLSSGYLRRKWEVVLDKTDDNKQKKVIVTRDEIVALLLSPNVVKISSSGRKKFFVQKRGIPQGSCLSTLLCCYYFGFLERKHGLIQPPSSLRNPESSCNLLMRWVDDYLFVTSSLTNAKEFIERVSEWRLLYGIELREDKTRLLVAGACTMRVTWCGILFLV